jgi:ubiquinone/menaquinone biosynthesis C-methylase UbiE
MDSRERRIVVDIGGGTGTLARRRARENSDTIYCVADPRAENFASDPSNYRIIPHLIGDHTPLPCPENTVSQVWIHYVMGEVLDNNGSGNKGTTAKEEMELYAPLVREAHRVLSPGGDVWAIDAQGNGEYTRRVFSECGFSVGEARKVDDELTTPAVFEAYEHFYNSSRPRETSEIIPIQFIAKKISVLCNS